MKIKISTSRVQAHFNAFQGLATCAWSLHVCLSYILIYTWITLRIFTCKPINQDRITFKPVMSHRILLTGASGYLGGSLLERWSTFNLPPYEKLFALVRTADQRNAVQQQGATPLEFDVRNEVAVAENVVSNRITIVLFLIDAAKAESQVFFMRALAEVKRSSGIDVHFLHVSSAFSSMRIVKEWFDDISQTSGAKLFSSHAGAPVDRPLLDTEDLYQVQKAQKPIVAPMQSVSPALSLGTDLEC